MLNIVDPAIQHVLTMAIHHIKDFSISLLDMHGVFLFWNKGAVNIDGYEPNEIIGKHLRTLHTAIDKKEKLGERLLSKAAKEGQVNDIGKRMKKDGSTYWASIVMNGIFDEAGKLKGFIRIARPLSVDET